ncbi:hypothetical protein HYE82_31440 [Streptomyces sp. BR123]|uniref:hypothetical protein n=1 Tax=Streptomyces sp. BR123 TaxID=2749828 RepID=UPI0015C4CAAD|nr:hypothetical protein [Streptomyces sp. BR123]NXY98816.1 hypothetical protein [Streptomyces sp. BR123]
MTTDDRVRGDEDLAFFEAVAAAFRKYPEAQGRYALASLEQEIELGIDFGRQVGVSRVEGRRIITEFEDRGTPESPGPRAAHMRLCIERDIHGKRLMWIEAPE